MREMLIGVELKSVETNPMGVVKFSHEGKTIGAVDVRLSIDCSFDFAFRKFVQSEWNWQIDDPHIDEMLRIYRSEIAAGTDYRNMTYRFIPLNSLNPWQSPWRLTEDKSDIYVPKVA
ncbi:MAG: hypothetical protein KBD06_01970 [Candidatus Pacebacteria bacterium]|nr:hypothetical protein [Candidatus Paceibacterota bacterium]